MPSKFEHSLIKKLASHVLNTPEKVLFKKESQQSDLKSITYKELQREIHQIGRQLNKQTNVESVILLFDDTIEFIIGFLACQLTGKIAIPMFYPKNKRQLKKLEAIILDSGCDMIFCSDKRHKKIEKGLIQLKEKLLYMSINFQEIAGNDILKECPNEISFIQYTSGSTGVPKGVVVSRENLLENQKQIKEAFGCNETSVILSWLPYYHDMGLIGNLLHAFYVGCTCVIVPPVEVIQNPLFWLKSIEKNKATHSGGPNYIYDQCIDKISSSDINELNLESWQVTYNGSEPVNKKTIEVFSEKFKSAKFNSNTFRTCYGLAEATLIVSGGVPLFEKDRVSSGKVCKGIDIVFYSSESNNVNLESGEICLFGKNISKGYWKKNDDADFFIEYKGERYLRTGDFGEIINGELFVTGRLKEMIIINGKNFYPYDIENEIFENNPEINQNAVVVSFLKLEIEKPLVFVELRREYLKISFSEIIREIDKLLIELLGCAAFDIVLLSPRKLPRTSSGKLQRLKVKNDYIAKSIDILSSKKELELKEVNQLNELAQKIKQKTKNSDLLEEYLLELLREKLSISIDDLKSIKEVSILENGVNSLIGVEISNQINKDLEVKIEVSDLLKLNQLEKIHEYIMNLLWIKSKPSSSEEIII